MTPFTSRHYILARSGLYFTKLGGGELNLITNQLISFLWKQTLTAVLVVTGLIKWSNYLMPNVVEILYDVIEKCDKPKAHCHKYGAFQTWAILHQLSVHQQYFQMLHAWIHETCCLDFCKLRKKVWWDQARSHCLRRHSLRRSWPRSGTWGPSGIFWDWGNRDSHSKLLNFT